MKVFNKYIWLFRALATSSLLSLFIYLHHFNLNNYIIETISGLLGIYFLLLLKDRREGAITGFFIGIFWFYWVSFSMEYYDLAYLIIPTIIIFGLGYAFLYFLITFYKNMLFRSVMFSFSGYFEPFSFDWYKPELIFINTPFENSALTLLFISFGIISIIYFIKFIKTPVPFFIITAIIFFASAINFNFWQKNRQNNLDEVINNLPLKIKIVKTDIKQAEKWKKENRHRILDMNFHEIEKAYLEGYDLVILPESTFPMFINVHPEVIIKLKEMSKNITIWTGGLYFDGVEHFNATYLFQDSKFRIGKKVLLVPFGEYIPLPKFIADWINDIFFDGLKDFTPAITPTDFEINGIIIRSAICYEGTSKLFYEDKIKYMAVITNNGWFYPSIEPTLQKLLMQYYSNMSGTIIFHSANRIGSGLIYPKK